MFFWMWMLIWSTLITLGDLSWHYYFFFIVASIQKLPAASVLTDINFPMKGRKGMVDWARNSEDRVVIPKSIFTPVSSKGKYVR